MLIGLFSFGLSVNSSEDFLDELFMFTAKTDTTVSEIASGVVIDLLSVCRTIASAGQYIFDITDTSVKILTIPALFTCFAYIIIVFVVYVNRCAKVTESTVPQQVFCFRAFQLQQIEVLPQKKVLTSSERPPILWNSISAESPAKMDNIEFIVENKYRDIIPDVELYEHVAVDQEKLVWKPMKSLFSYENWY